MPYFIKGGKLHRYPPPPICTVIYKDEPLLETVPKEVKKCYNCFVRLPKNKRKWSSKLILSIFYLKRLLTKSITVDITAPSTALANAFKSRKPINYCFVCACRAKWKCPKCGEELV